MVQYIKLGKPGEEKTLPVCYNNLALEEFQELTGISLFDVGDELTKNIKNVTALAFVGLKHGFLEVNDYKKECEITYKDVGRWLNVASTGEVFKAYSKSIPKGDSEGAESAEGAESKKLVGQTSDV